MKSDLLMFGASRGTGMKLIQSASDQRRPVTAVARSVIEPIPGVRCCKADALDRKQAHAICRDAPGGTQVVCMISGGDSGNSADFEGTTNVIEAAKSAGLRRFLLVTSLGCGDSRAHASERLLEAIGEVLERKSRAEQHLRASGLDFTILRPGRLFDGPPDGKTRLFEDPGVHGSLTRGDLARVILECLDDPSTVGKTYSAVRPEEPAPLPRSL